MPPRRHARAVDAEVGAGRQSADERSRKCGCLGIGTPCDFYNTSAAPAPTGYQFASCVLGGISSGSAINKPYGLQKFSGNSATCSGLISWPRLAHTVSINCDADLTSIDCVCGPTLTLKALAGHGFRETIFRLRIVVKGCDGSDGSVAYKAGCRGRAMAFERRARSKPVQSRFHPTSRQCFDILSAGDSDYEETVEDLGFHRRFAGACVRPGRLRTIGRGCRAPCSRRGRGRPGPGRHSGCRMPRGGPSRCAASSYCPTGTSARARPGGRRWRGAAGAAP
jgi:hypothetical protein